MTLTKLRRYLEEQEEAFFDRWVRVVGVSDIQYPGIISEDILTEGAQIYRQLGGALGRSTYELAPRKRINQIGKRLGEKRAMTGVPLEAVLELFITFRHELWDLISEGGLELSTSELMEARRRIDLYLDQLIASIAYSYTATKERAMVGLIEKLLS